eukprot:CAMPEP_0175733908 /NCGR_PEP_ID=MMETSP0097-20121207/52118_1 /TAXON_ID=311494 /ORGANISM="Alexandrium monilatum, Strain CCMP3105" /LENGTH=240 /DNA_ID=CAMNT_0017041929 /DNA_START=5 /DNA_END=727 /DNA_ORIENTATION=-
MPVEIWLQCTCPDTRPGDVLVAVGDHPKLGGWSPAHTCAVLSTGPESFPRWELKAPLVLEEGPSFECFVEYKYVILHADQCCRWEDLNGGNTAGVHKDDFDLDFGNAQPAMNTSSPERTSLYKSFLPANRRFTVLGDAVVFRAEHFDNSESTAAASWPVGPDWAPAVAGGSAVLGRGKRNSHNPQCELQYRFPHQLFAQPRRARLLAGIGQMCSQRDLPPGLWHRILGYVAPDLAGKRCH